MTNISFPVTKNILFTGAGFTYNFGGLLAKTMWAEIHNRIQKYNLAKLNRLIKDNYDYEELYNEVLNSANFDDLEKEAFINVVYEAYETLDQVIRYYNVRSQATTPIDIDKLSEFILRFGGKGKERGFFFTINQDIFIERYFSGTGFDRPKTPGIKVDNLRFSTFDKRGKDLTPPDYARIPNKLEVDAMASQMGDIARILYIKLHGSSDWRDEQNNRKLIIGTNKEHDIKIEPILSLYYDLFNLTLKKDNRRMLIIGYGFRDPHINDIIVSSIIEHGLRLYIICPMDPQTFTEKTLTSLGKNKDVVWESVKGYYPYSLAEIFPFEHSRTKHLDNLCNDFF